MGYGWIFQPISLSPRKITWPQTILVLLLKHCNEGKSIVFPEKLYWCLISKKKMWFLPFFPPVQRDCNNFRALLQPTRVSFVGHNSWDAWGWQGSGTCGKVRVGAACWESTGGIAQAQRTWLWVIHFDCIYLKIIPWKSSLWAGFPFTENMLGTCRRA